MQRQSNIFDKIGSLIPGYSGYAERDGRRQCDKLLREKIVVILDSSENVITQRIATNIKNQDYGPINEYEEVRKKLNTLKSRIKFSAYGESAFFSSNQIKENELLTIYQRDLDLLDKANDLQHTISKLDIQSIALSVEEMEVMINDRNEYIKEYK